MQHHHEHGMVYGLQGLTVLLCLQRAACVRGLGSIPAVG